MATVLVCDICDTRKDVKRRSWVVSQEMGPEGTMDTVDTIRKTVDLCPSCEVYLLSRILYDILGEKIRNRPAIETEFGKRMWEEYRKVIGKVKDGVETVQKVS